MSKKNNLKLIYVLKIGYNSKKEGLYEFIFSKNPYSIDFKNYLWDQTPASDNAEIPVDEDVDLVLTLKTKKFNLYCLHEAYDRPYLHGYYNIHALAYETYDEEDNVQDFEDLIKLEFGTDEDMDDLPLLVFHYGMDVEQVKDILYTRDIVLEETTKSKQKA